MTSRILAVSVGIVIGLGLAGISTGQEADSGTAQKDSGKSKSSGSSRKKAKGAPASGKSAKGDESSSKREKATFGGGCFWCQEAIFERIRGVKSVVSGYAGGTVPNPSYEMVHSGLTGHAEVVQITFDPDVVSYERLLEIFWKSHDPTTFNRQGPDEGPQYRSIILYHNEKQKEQAQKSHDAIVKARVYPGRIVTQLAPMTRFYPAEQYHQDYFRRNRGDQYSIEIIEPKLQMMRYKLQHEAETKAKDKSESKSRSK